MSKMEDFMEEFRTLLGDAEAASRAVDAAWNELIELESRMIESNQKAIRSPTQGISVIPSLNEDQPLREQMMYEGRPIPAAGSAAADLVACARAEAAELKRAAPVDTDPE